MKKLINLAIALLTLVGCEFQGHVDSQSQSVQQQVLSALDTNVRAQKAEAELQAIRDKQVADEKLGQYAINMMYRAGAGKTLSDGKKLILARSIVRVANDIFDREIDKKGFITVLAIESSFNRFAQSPTGPKGYGQLAKTSFHEAMKDCGLDNMKDEDVWETDLNLYAAACYFNKMLDGAGEDRDPGFAIVSYNQGPNSEAAKSYAKSGSMDNIEALKYVARFNFLSRKVSDTVAKDVPAIADLPKPAVKAESKASRPEVKKAKAK